MERFWVLENLITNLTLKYALRITFDVLDVLAQLEIKLCILRWKQECWEIYNAPKGSETFNKVFIGDADQANTCKSYETMLGTWI